MTATAVEHPHRGRATLLVLGGACCFGSVPVLTVIATRAGATLLAMLTIRFAIAAVVLLVIAGGIRRARVAPRLAISLVVLGGGTQAALSYLSLSSLAYISAATLAFLFYTYPAWVAVVQAIRGAEPLRGRRFVALVVSLAGITLMIGFPGSSAMHPVGVALAISSALIYAAYLLVMNRLNPGVAPTVAAAWVTGGVTVALGLAGVATGTLVAPPTTMSWIAIVLLALISTVAAFLALYHGLAVLGPVRTSIISTVEPFCTAALGTFVLGQRLTPGTITGGVFIAAAVLLLHRD